MQQILINSLQKKKRIFELIFEYDNYVKVLSEDILSHISYFDCIKHNFNESLNLTFRFNIRVRKQDINDYFSILLKKINNNLDKFKYKVSIQTIVLADYFLDKEFYNYVIFPLFKEKDIELYNPALIEKYIEDYLYLIKKKEQLTFYHKIKIFYNCDKELAKFIWENCNKDELMDILNIPHKRRNVLMKCTFLEIQGYLNRFDKSN